jgi:hypothetical protein
MTQLFYDSTQPAKIPAGSHACLYFDGDYKAILTPAQAERFKAIRWITVLGGAAAAAHTGVLDFEKGNAAFDGNNLREWAEARKAMDCRARVYTDLANLPAARKQVEGLANVVFWLATLDGNKLWASYIPELWGVQYAGGVDADYDTSVLYGTW